MTTTIRDRMKVLGIWLVLAVTAGVAFAPGAADAHVTPDDVHLWTAHIKPRLATVGTINTSTNPVDWTRLKGVPAGFADGADSTGPLPGFGLTRTSPLFYPIYDRVDQTKIQRRVTGTCGSNSSISSIAQDGSVSCQPDDAARAYYHSDDDTGGLCNWTSVCSEGSLAVPAGTYMVLAKIRLTSEQDEAIDSLCGLKMPGQSSWAGYSDSSGAGADWGNTHAIMTVSLQAVHTFEEAGSTSVVCSDMDDYESFGSYLKIIAIPLSGVSISEP